MRKSQTSLLLPPSSDSQQQQQHNNETRGGGGGAGTESYSSASSFSDSYSDSSDLANWEEYVADDGTLFYAEYMAHLKRPSATTATSTPPDRKVDFTRSSSLRMAKKPQSSRRQQQQQQQQQQSQQQSQHQHSKSNGNSTPSSNETELRFSQISKANSAFKQLELVITAADRYRFGRRSTAVESILGFRVVPYPDQPECLMVHSFVHEMPSMQGQQPAPIQRGDWFKSLDDIEVRASNVDDLLLQFVEPTKVTLMFQGAAAANGLTTAGLENGGDQAADGAMGATAAALGGGPLVKVENFHMFAEHYERMALGVDTASTASASATAPPSIELPFALLMLPPECYQSDQHKDSLYYYPDSATANFLYKARGSFLTLNAVLTAELQTKPHASKLLVDQREYYVNYRTLNGFLVLIAYAAALITPTESQLRADELLLYMRFAFPRLHIENFGGGSSSSSSSALRRFLHAFCAIQRVRLLSAARRRGLFEELLRESRHMPLPKEAQLRIFDALSEMEAMDYRNWNDDPLNTHREFFIHGSVLYYDAHLLASQMPVEVRSHVECFMRCRGVFDFVAEQCVRELYVWQEIELPNAPGRYFLTVCSRSHLILAVILKIFDAPDLQAECCVPPSLFYIEEIQETLDHLIQCGIESLAMFWSVSNKRPEVLCQLEEASPTGDVADSRKLEAFIKQKLTASGGGTSAAAAAAAAATTATQRGPANETEDGHLCSSLGGSSIHSLTPSEDDGTKKHLQQQQQQQQRHSTSNNNNNNDDSDSGSDWENFNEQNPLHYGLDAETQSQMTESLWKEINNVVPVKISAGWKNAVFYYVYVDTANGTVFCPLKANSEQFPFLQEMRRACHLIHNVLQNTKSLRRQLAQESTKSSAAGKGQLAIKEHGVTIEVRDSSNGGAQVIGRFVVVGRLFFAPTKEVYVCHRPDVPQNMVEMAFRLSFFSVG